MTTQVTYTPFYGDLFHRVFVHEADDALLASADAARISPDGTYLYFRDDVPDDTLRVATSRSSVPHVLREFYREYPDKTVRENLYYGEFRVKVVIKPRWSIVDGDTVRTYIENEFLPMMSEILEPDCYLLGNDASGPRPIILYFRDIADFNAVMLGCDNPGVRESIADVEDVVTLREVEEAAGATGD